METWEIIVLIIFLILLAIGIGVTIYFVIKYEEDQKKKTQGPTGPAPPTPVPPGPSPPSPVAPTGATGNTGATGSVTFSISPSSNSNLYMTFVPDLLNPQVVTSNGSTLSCTDYKWQLINNSVNPSLLSVFADPTNVIPYNSPINLSNNRAGLIGDAIVSNSGLTPENSNTVLNWQYTSDKRWCGIGPVRSNFCLYHNSNNTVSVNAYIDADPNFIWDIVPSIASPICRP